MGCLEDADSGQHTGLRACEAVFHPGLGNTYSRTSQWLGAGSLLVTKEGDGAGPAEGIPCGAVPQVLIPTPPPHASHTCFDPKQIRCGKGGVM